ncbi:ABC transporter permease [Streptomyces sp. 4R-3d]|uniref:ABC transporter permease n=1 Tax=Streptomyces sp. 4R-3d TaxID=2559605 RepID=UPI0010720B76|nr:ABC transporter permease [Streptomyces sp. 4R-3d]TFI24766.1 ABC transporter permease [Streptomyces sp. 4R-3d]
MKRGDRRDVVRGGGVVALLAARGARTHRRAWAAVFAALALGSLLLGTLGLAAGSAALGHARVERYAGAGAVVAGTQSTRYSAKPWGSEARTVRAGLTERVRVPARALEVVRQVPGVRAAVADVAFPVTVRGSAATGRPWEATRLASAPTRLLEGRPPTGAREIVVGKGVARTGDRLSIPYGTGSATDTHTYTVTGVSADARRTVHFSRDEAHRLAGRPGELDAIGVLADSGVPDDVLRTRVRHALDAADLRDVSAPHRADDDPARLRVLTGDARGEAEFLAAAPARMPLLQVLASLASVVVLVGVLVVTSTVAQALRQRARELALLRAVGATPWQLRRAVGREVGRIAVLAAVVGAVGAVPAYLASRALLVGRGAVPEGLELPFPPWLAAAPLGTAGLMVLIAWLTALGCCARAARTRPAEALREEEPGSARQLTGCVLLGLGAASAGAGALQHGAAAAAAASASALTMVIGCALLGPWLARGAMRVLGAPMRRLGVGGRLAASACTANAARLGAAITPVVLVTAFVLVQLAGGATLGHEAAAQARAAARADVAVSGPGVPYDAVERIRRLPGVAAATAVAHGTVVVPGKELGEPSLERLPVLGVTPRSLARTLDPAVREGSTDGLRPGTVAVGTDRARTLGVRLGDHVQLRFDDGAEARLRVVATYERALALGDFLFSYEELTRHMTAPPPVRVLAELTPGASPTSLSTAFPGARVERDPVPERVRAEDQALGDVLTAVAVTAIGGFTVIAVLSTLTLISVGRGPELRQLRLAGADRRRLRRMLLLESAATATAGLSLGTATAALPLLAFALSAAGRLPWLPPGQGALIVAVVVLTTASATLLPARGALRGRYPVATR